MEVEFTTWLVKDGLPGVPSTSLISVCAQISTTIDGTPFALLPSTE